jgi:predicted acyl esterase
LDYWSTQSGGNPDFSGARVIPAGHRLRVVVASAAFPKYDRNLNTGGDNERGIPYIVVRRRILHDRAHPSFVRLPIIPR